MAQNELAATGIQTWVLGHIHKPYDVDLAGTRILYTGSLQALSAKEQGPHGFLLLTVDQHRTGVEKIPLSTARYEGLEVSVDGMSTREELQAGLVDAVQRDGEGRLAEMEDVQFLSYDIRLIGSHANESDIMAWASASRRDLALQVGSYTTASVRSVESKITPAIGDLAELSREPSPAGILAATILALQTNTTTPVLAALEVKWERQRSELQRAPAYLPLLSAGQLTATSSDARMYLLRECNRLLSQLQQERATNR